jgi:hypothetical protein
MTTAKRIAALAFAAGCLCSVQTTTLGVVPVSGAERAPEEAGAVIALSVPSERPVVLGEARALDPRILGAAFGPAQMADAALQPVVIPPPDMREVAAEDARALDNGPAPTRIGVLMAPVGGNVTVDRDGIWDVLPDGTQTWTLVIRVPGAKGSSIEFTNLALPEGSVLLIRNSAGELQTWEGNGPNGNGFLQTPIIEGEVAEVQYIAPPGVVGAPAILINKVSHIYRLGALDPQADDRPSDDRVTYACHIDVMCPINGGNADANARDAVGAMFFSGNTVCSGGLLADTDPNTFKGWFLTANHCISTQGVVNTLTVYWKYQKPTCGGVTPSLASRPQSVGGTLIATNAQTDFTLIRTANDPLFPGNAAGSPTFAAWTTTTPSNGSLVRGIHHPNFEYKRWSEGTTTVAQPICGGFSTSFFYYGDWKTNIEYPPTGGGMTEGGSSGSPLFNTSWEVIGQLFGSCSFPAGVNCNTPADWNWIYGKFSQSYANNPAVATSLTTITPDDGFEDNDSASTGAALPLGVHNLVLIDPDDYFVVTIDCPTTLTVSATFTTSQMDLDLYLYNQFDSLLSSQTGLGSPKTIVFAVNPGTYKIRAAKATGWGGSYTLDVSIAPSCVVNGVCCFQCSHGVVPGTCPDGSNFVASFCSEISAAQCAALGGSYRGDGTTCAGLNACTCPGDVNGDGDTNISDFNIVAGSFGLGAPGCLSRTQGDLTCDGIVNISDFNVLSGNFGCTGN